MRAPEFRAAVTAAGAGSRNIAHNEDRLAGALRGSRPADVPGRGRSPATGLTPTGRAAREFGLERSVIDRNRSDLFRRAVIPLIASSASERESLAATRSSTVGAASAAMSATAPGRSVTRSSAGGGAGSAAEREFGIG